MMACGEEDLSDQVVCAIEDCGYTSIPAIAEKQVRSAFGIATQPVLIGLSTLIKNARAVLCLGKPARGGAAAAVPCSDVVYPRRGQFCSV